MLPLGKRLRAKRGASLRDLLFPHGVEFPCGGRGRCKGCRVKVLAGELAITDDDRARLSEGELAQGWRLACRAVLHDDIRLELAQWEAAILTDNTSFAFQPRQGLGIAIDLGTTTLVAQLLDLATADVLAVRTALNAQAQHGADVMSRIEYAVAEKGPKALETLIRRQIGRLIEELMPRSEARGELRTVVLAGNTVMHHLFCGIDLEPLSHYPFEPVDAGLQVFRAQDLGWPLSSNPEVRFLPCLGGFVGSDILAGILATRLHESPDLRVLVDLGTNGEIVVGNRDSLLCASTAAGPAFEGARISMGMRAASGAVSEVIVRDGHLECHVLGNVKPRGVCGSGLVDAVAAGLDLALIKSSGRFASGESFPLADPVALNQRDIRELQLAKGAIAAGLKLLLLQRGSTDQDIVQVHLAGAFGNYINQASARRIGLLDFPADKISADGNTSLLGAKMALFDSPEFRQAVDSILAKTRHVSLNEDPRFQDVFVDEMFFPEPVRT